MTASMSVVMRCTPWAMTAIPPITIHGAPTSDSALLSVASASSIRDLSGSRRAGTLLDADPTTPHLLDRVFTHGISRAWPSSHGLQRCECGQRMGNRTRGTRPFRRLQLTLRLR
jgi:hypothetical protein